MTERVAVGRHMLEKAPRIQRGRGGSYRPSGRRLMLLAAVACVGMLVLAASSAQAASLPDNRGYELVTPPNKDNNGPYIRPGVFGGDQVSADGNAVSYGALETFPGSQSFGGSFLATRTSSGWSNANVIPPQTKITGELCSVNASMVAYSSDMSKAVLADGLSSSGGCPVDDPRLVPGEPEGVQNLFVASPTTGTYQLVDLPPVSGAPADANYAGASSDLRHVLFTSSAQLTSDAPGGATNLYEWVGGDTPSVSLVTEVPMSGATSCSNDCTPATGSIASGTQAFHAVSDDGSIVYFTANGNFYARENGTTTVQVDAPAAGGSGPGGGGQFVGASADGSTVFFTDGDGVGLTSDTVSGSGNNLYECDLTDTDCQLTDLTSGSDAEVQGFSGMSDDGSYIYFVANGSLANGATAGQPNLYVSHNGGTPTFIATLDPSDSGDWSSSAPTARASSNGQFFVFTSIDNLTTTFDGMGRREIFLFSAAGGPLSCVSCSPSGVAPTADTNINGGQVDGFAFGAATILARYVSDTGQVFFDTPNALLPADIDGALDTYEYEAGHLSLLSSGTDTTGALYVDNTADGNNVVFVTSTPLVPQDSDGGAYDFYDARVGGGLPVPTSPTPPCQSDGCKPQPSSSLPAPVPGSSTFTGPANPKFSNPPAKIKVMKGTVKGATFTLRLKVSGRGRIVVSGGNIKRVSRSVGHAGTYTVIAHLTSKAKERLKHKHRLKLSIRAQYVSSTGSVSTVKLNLTAKA